jgi:hypothetical protein
MFKITSSILDFPRKVLSEDIWQYQSNDKQNELPILKPQLKYLIISTVNKYLSHIGLKLIKCNLLGGSASYQWTEGSDIDVSVYVNWPEDTTEETKDEYCNYFSKIEVPYKGFEIHFFLNKPENKFEIADAVYDVFNDEWVLPPLILPKHFDPDDYFKPFMKVAETKAKKFDDKIGELRRAWSVMSKASENKEGAVEPDSVEKRINKEKKEIRKIIKSLIDAFMAIRDKRYAMYDSLREKMRENVEIGRFERFQEPEIIWKYLDRSGYIDFLRKIYKLEKSDQLAKILSTY